MATHHQYQTHITWTGNNGTGTSGYRDYDRSHLIDLPGKAAIAASSDPAFRGDATKHNPEELLLSALSSCHMLWYLHLCADAGIIVLAYEDEAKATMDETEDGGQFTAATLYPLVTVAEESMIPKAYALHEHAHAACFIARSVNFPVTHQPKIQTP